MFGIRKARWPKDSKGHASASADKKLPEGQNNREDKTKVSSNSNSDTNNVSSTICVLMSYDTLH
jgi:hypothetical protein